MVLGPACEDATFSTAAITSRYSKDIHVSYAASSPLLSEVEHFPLFYSSVPSYTTYNKAIYSIMKLYSWWNIGVVNQEERHYTVALENLANFFNIQNMDSKSDSDSNANIVTTLALNFFLGQRSPLVINTRIFVAMVPENQAAAVMCAAFRYGMIGENYQWILLGDYKDGWWMNKENRTLGINREHKLQCSQDDMLQAVESILILSHHQQISSPEVRDTFSDRHLTFWKEFESMVGQSNFVDSYQSRWATRVASTYDAVWSIAHAMKRVLVRDGDVTGEGNPNSTEGANRSPIIMDSTSINSNSNRGLSIRQTTATFNAAMEMTDFEGISGRINFNNSSHTQREPVTYISQMQSGIMVPVGIHLGSSDSTNLTFYGNDLTWQGNSLPRDRPIRTLKRISLWLVCVMLVISALGLILCIITLVINWIYRKHKVIKASSPYINFIIVSGCICGYLSIYFMSVGNLDVNMNIPSRAYPFLCNIRPWLLSFAFTLAFGALFAKTFRIYLIFKDPFKKKLPFKDHTLFAMLGFFLAYDIVVLVVWAIVNPLSLSEEIVNSNPAEFTEEQYFYCVPTRKGGVLTSFILWIFLVTLPKALLLIFGVFLVIRTSKIKAIFFRDAKFTGIAIFGFVVACTFGVPTSFITMFFFQQNLTYIAATSTILTCCFLVLGMVFIPKFLLLQKYRKKVPTRVLLGLNPSFHVHRNARTDYIRRTARKPKPKQSVSLINLFAKKETLNCSPTFAIHSSKACTSQHKPSTVGHSNNLTNCQSLASHRCSGYEEVVQPGKLKENQENLGTLEGWWEPAFEDESDRAAITVQEAFVCFDGYEAIIYTLVDTKQDRMLSDSNSSADNNPAREDEALEISPSSMSTSMPSYVFEDKYIDSGDSRNHVPYFQYFSVDGESTSPRQAVKLNRSVTFCQSSV